MPTEERSPTANVGLWKLPAQAYVRDFVCAFVIGGGLSHQYFTYGFNIPAGATIVSVKVKPYHAELGALKSSYLSVSWDSGFTWSAEAEIQVVGNCAMSALDICDATGLTAWTPAKLSDANFRTKIRSAAVTGCMTYGSKVRMFDGSRVVAEDLRLGDEILSWRPTKKKCKGIVVAIDTHRYLKHAEMYKLSTEREPLTLTELHMACITKEHTFREAGKLTIKEHLMSEEDTLFKILKVEKVLVKKMINIQVDMGTLYVNGWLIHNLEKVPW